MTTSEPVHLSVEVQALLLRTVIGETEKALADLKKHRLSIAYPLPATVPIESPLDGQPLGKITRERSTPKWTLTSLEQFAEYLTREFPGAFETVFMVDIPGVEKPVPLPDGHPLTVALAESGLLTPMQRVREEVIVETLVESEENGIAAAPGIQLVRPRQGDLVVNYDKKTGPAAVRRLVRAGLFALPWDEQPAIAAAAPKAVAS